MQNFSLNSEGNSLSPVEDVAPKGQPALVWDEEVVEPLPGPVTKYSPMNENDNNNHLLERNRERILLFW